MQEESEKLVRLYLESKGYLTTNRRFRVSSSKELYLLRTVSCIIAVNPKTKEKIGVQVYGWSDEKIGFPMIVHTLSSCFAIATMEVFRRELIKLLEHECGHGFRLYLYIDDVVRDRKLEMFLKVRNITLITFDEIIDRLLDVIKGKKETLGYNDESPVRILNSLYKRGKLK